MALGLCCQWIEPRKKRDNSTIYENIINEKKLQLGRFNDNKYSFEFVREVYINNIDEHIKIVSKLVENNIKSFRISSGFLPLFEFNSWVLNDEFIHSKLLELGQLFKKNNIRVTTHPSQFVILNSDDDRVINNSIKELEYHAWIFDKMGLERSLYNSINIHGGKKGNNDKLINVINNLNDSVKLRLTLENDERCFSVNQLLQIQNQTDIAIVLDSHHHIFNPDGLSLNTAFELSMRTWKNIKPIQHLSNSELGTENSSFMEKRKHSFYIHNVPLCQLDALQNNIVDIDIEAKGKNISILKMRNDFKINS